MDGLIHIYTGNGKGKTTTAIGLGMRAWGRGMRVLMLQFMKGHETGEMFAIEKLAPGFKLDRGKKLKKFTWDMNEEELKELKADIIDSFRGAVLEAESGNWDMLILDELVGAVSGGYLPLQEVAGFLKSRPKGLEIVMTGRNAPKELVDLADYVSEIAEVKHPYKEGVQARKGIEY